MREIILALIIVILSLLLLNPLELWMPSGSDMAVTGAFLIAFATFALFIFRESAGDEREVLHRNMSGRVAFLAGAGILVLGITLEGLRHNIDPWLIVALIAMVLGKVAGLFWSRKYR